MTVSYTVPTDMDANRIQDAAGNDAAALTDQAVTNATPGIVLSPTSLTVAEGGTGTYTVRLNTQPTGNVTVTVARSTGSADVTFDTDAAERGADDAGVHDGELEHGGDGDGERGGGHRHGQRQRHAERTRPRAAATAHTRADLSVKVNDAGDTTAPGLSGTTPADGQRLLPGADVQRGAGHELGAGVERVHGDGGGFDAEPGGRQPGGGERQRPSRSRWPRR